MKSIFTIIHTCSLLRCLSNSWIERPPSPNWSIRSFISSARFLFSLWKFQSHWYVLHKPLVIHVWISYRYFNRYFYLLTLSNCSTASSQAALSLNNSLLWLRHSLCELSNSADRSSHFKRHSPTTLSNVFNFFSATATWPLILSNSTWWYNF